MFPGKLDCTYNFIVNSSIKAELVECILFLHYMHLYLYYRLRFLVLVASYLLNCEQDKLKIQIIFLYCRETIHGELTPLIFQPTPLVYQSTLLVFQSSPLLSPEGVSQPQCRQ